MGGIERKFPFIKNKEIKKGLLCTPGQIKEHKRVRSIFFKVHRGEKHYFSHRTLELTCQFELSY